MPSSSLCNRWSALRAFNSPASSAPPKLTISSVRTLYLEGNHLTSLDLNGKSEIWNFDYAVQSYAIDVNEDGTFDLSSLPNGFDASKTTDWEGGTRVENTLKVNSHEVQYTYNTGSRHYRQKWMEVKLKVNGHKYQWKYDNAKHWRICALKDCPGLTDAQEAPHVYDNAKDRVRQGRTARYICTIEHQGGSDKGGGRRGG